MIRCERCGLLIEDESITERLRYELFDGRYEGRIVHRCPACGGGCLVSAKKCVVCGGYFTEDELRDFACEDCRDVVLAKFAYCLSGFDDREREVLSSLYRNDRLEPMF